MVGYQGGDQPGEGGIRRLVADRQVAALDRTRPLSKLPVELGAGPVVEQAGSCRPDVFLRGQPGAVRARRVLLIRQSRADLLHLEPVPPVVAEVIGVIDDIARARRDVVQCRAVLVAGRLPEHRRESVQQDRLVAYVADLEGVQVVVVPPERRLEHQVQLSQRDRRRHDQSAPHRGPDVPQGHPHRVDRRGRCRAIGHGTDSSHPQRRRPGRGGRRRPQPARRTESASRCAYLILVRGSGKPRLV